MTRQDFNAIDTLRLEVKIPATGPTNLVRNPAGELGGWGWITPNASFIRRAVGGSQNVLEHVAAGAGTAFSTESMPMTAGHYAAASFTIPPPVAVPAVTVRIEWIDAAGTVLSISAASPSFSTFGPAAYGPVQAPANTRFMRFRFDQAGAGTFRFTNVIVASAPTAGALGSQRTNRVPNPSFAVDLFGWSSGFTTNPPTLTRVATPVAVGNGAMQVSGNGGYVRVQTTLAVTGGKDYTLQAQYRAAVTVRQVQFSVRWRDAGGVLISTSYWNHSTVASTAAYTAYARTFTAPANAATGDFAVGHPGPESYGAGIMIPSGEIGYWDAVMVTDGTDVPAYFDGVSTPTATTSYAWTGTAHMSSSVQTDTTLGSLPPVEWRNVLGKTHTVKTARESLNLGTLEAEVLDSTLDPATSATLRPGGGVRALALVGAAWEPFFVGEIDRLVVDYDEKTLPARPPRISLTALDNTRRLAGARRANGVAAVADLPHVLEGAGVPWDVNGSTAQVLTTPATVSVNENATALDQVALTRDSNAAHAWVNRKGVLVATTAAAGAPVRTLTEPRYSDLQVTFTSESVMNAILIESVVMIDNRAETITYGPYEDAPSIAQWGRRERRFTVHGLTAVQINALGAAILTRNATPGVTVQSVTLPMRSLADLDDAIRDLGEIVRVSNTAKGLAPDMRVTSVTHTIESEPAKWLVTLGFTTAGSVAAPTASPEVQVTGAGVDTGWTDVAYLNGWFTYNAGSYGTFAWKRINGVVYLRGLVQNNDSSGVNLVKAVGFLPVGCRPARHLIFTAATGAGTRDLYVQWDGQVFFPTNTYWGTWLSVACSFPADQ